MTTTFEKYKSPENFNDRELSWIAFNERVLEEAEDVTTPLLERLRFLGIVSSNLDEFFMVRVSGVQEQVKAGVRVPNAAGHLPEVHFRLVHERIHAQIERQYRCLQEAVLPALEKEGVYLRTMAELTRGQRDFVRRFFDREVFPVLTPLAVDSGHPFPHLRNLSLNLAVRLNPPRKEKSNELFALVQVPSMLERFVKLPPQKPGNHEFLLLEELISSEIHLLFPGLKCREVCAFRVTRDADIEYAEDDADDLLKTVEDEIRRRERGDAVRLGIERKASPLLVNQLRATVGLDELQVYLLGGPINLAEVAQITNHIDRSDLKYPVHVPSQREPLRSERNIFRAIARGDILVHHPYESFAPVVDLVEQAANDPSVLAIKMTLYRTSSDSPIIKSLIKAAENGKQVAALMELKARFDEERNITLAKLMERAGVHVVYGLVGLKTHAKICLVVRKEHGGIRRYVHLGTGNYNPNTARLYTDLSLFTCDPDICDDASELFNLLTGYSRMPEWKKLAVAPINMRSRIQRLIEEQIVEAKAGRPGRIRAKMNSLVDPHIICKLYEASAAGVRIDLIVRGTCCLKAGVKGLSENIRVHSIVDRFLEHSRVYIFGEGGKESVYLASADWMPRNLDRRIEALVPIENPQARHRVITEVFELSIRDNTKRRELQADGTYRRSTRKQGEKPFRSQLVFTEIEAGLRDDSKPFKMNPAEVYVSNEEGSTEQPIPLQPIQPAARRVRIPASSPVREFHNKPRPAELANATGEQVLAPIPLTSDIPTAPRRNHPKDRSTETVAPNSSQKRDNSTGSRKDRKRGHRR